MRLERILYLEDDPSIAEIAIMGFECFSEFEVRHCWSGQEAIDAASDFDPQICLFDMMLPDMDGLHAHAMIRQLPTFAGLPVIYMTAKAQRHEVDRYMSAGALEVIIKPFDPVRLGRQVQNIWDTSELSKGDI